MKRELSLTFLLAGLLMACLSGFAQDKAISGTVIGEGAVPLPGVTVGVKESNKTAQTNADGIFKIIARPGQTLHFSFVGYDPKEVVIGDDAAIVVSMIKSEDKTLQDVV